MKMEMTEKDKKLLVMLAVFIIVVCIGYWGVYPIIKDIRTINESMLEQEDIRSINELKLSQVALMEADNANLESDITNARSAFFPMMTSAEIDRYFTDMVLSYGLYSYDLNIKMPTEETDLKPYQYSEKATVQDEEASEGTTSAASDELIFDDDVMTGIYTANISMRLGGDEKKLNQLVDDLSGSEKKLRVSRYSWSEERSMAYDSEEEGEYSIQIESVLTIELEIYMYEE